ncbi:MAG: hypothetical protein ACI82G_001029, partial [Bradymonadia bacterium]
MLYRTISSPNVGVTAAVQRFSTAAPWLVVSCLLLAAACGDGGSKPGDADSADGDTDSLVDVGDTDSGDTDVADTGSLCPGSAISCDDECVDPLTDESHCGNCATQCAPGDECVAGVCACPEAEQRCGFSCVNTQNDNDHCGQCDRVCGAEEVCSVGACVTTCEEGLVNCDGDCVDVQSDDNHCGRCDQVCSGDANEEASCEASVCLVGCVEGFYDLDGSPGCEYACPIAVPADEVCDGQDNDCDGLTDAADPSMDVPLCTRQRGVCEGAIATCAGGTSVECSDADYADHAAAYAAGEEVSCDGDDNDCDGEVDEGCCVSDLVVLEPVDDSEAIDVTVFQTYNLFDGNDSVTVYTGSRFAASYPELDFGVLGLDDDTAAILEVPPLAVNYGSSVIAEVVDNDLKWWTSTTSGVQSGATSRSGSEATDFTTVVSAFLRGTPFGGVASAFVSAERFLVGLNQRESGDRLRAVWLDDAGNSDARFWDFDITPASDGLAAWGTSDRFFVCATRLIEAQESIHCYALDTDLELITDFAFADLPSHDQIRPFASRPDG